MRDNEKWRLLMIDFDEDLLTRLQVLLEDRGFDTTAAWGGREASDMLDAVKFDIVLLSDYLPDTGGRALWRLLRKIPVDTELAVIRSSNPVTEDIQGLLEKHVRHCILPRSTPAQIADTVVQCLRQRNLREPATRA